MPVSRTLTETADNFRGIADALPRVIARHPNAVVMRNGVGNLAVMDDGEYVGYIEILKGEVVLLADEPW